MSLKLPLFDYQEVALRELLKNKYMILSLDMGMGKSFNLLALHDSIPGSKLLIICPAYLILNWKKEIDKFLSERVVSVFDKGNKMYFPFESDIVITSYDLAIKCEAIFEWATIVGLDECFHEDTLVATPQGEKRIQDIREGDAVYNFGGRGTVLKVKRRKIGEYVKIRYGNKDIICSLNHPFLTEFRGWVKASDLLEGENLCVNNYKLLRLRSRVQEEGERASDKEVKMLKTLLSEQTREEDLQSLQGGISYPFTVSKHFSSVCYLLQKMRCRFKESVYKRSNGEGRLPYSQRGGHRKIEGYPKTNRSQAAYTGGKWKNVSFRRVSYRAFKVLGVSKQLYTLWIKRLFIYGMPYSLQVRFCLSSKEDMSGNRWVESLSQESERGRQEERGNLDYVRVESIEIQKSRSAAGEGENYFYDLEVSGHPSFTVNGVLVHNCTEIKETKTKRSRAIHKLIYENSIKRVALLTGTPIKNRVGEFYSLIAICNYNPELKESKFLNKFPSQEAFSDYFSYRKEYSIFKYGRMITITKWEGVREDRIKELKEILVGIYHRIETDMPPITYKNVHISDIDEPGLLEEFKKFQDEASGVSPRAKQESAMKKAPLTCQYVKGLIDRGEVEGPLIVYTDHVEPCKFIANYFNTTPIFGEMPPSARHKMADDFQAGKIPVLAATIKAFSTGVTLTASNVIVENDYSWVPGDLRQLEFRISRKGQTRPCFVHRMIGSDQDKYILDTILKKAQTISAVT